MLNLRLPKPPPTYVNTRSFKHFDAEAFRQYLKQVSCTENMLIGDVNETVENFNRLFLDVQEKHVPFKRIKIKQRRCPFVDKNIKERMKERNQLLNIARKTKSPTD